MKLAETRPLHSLNSKRDSTSALDTESESMSPEFDDVDVFTEDDAQEHNAKRWEVSATRSALRYIHKGLNLSSSEIDRLRQERTGSLLQEKKLILILDLDNTLLHSTQDANISLEENLLVELTKEDPNKTLFRWGDRVIKLRPFVHTFLKEASEMYDMYIYPMGIRDYALMMAKLLDPQGIYFNSKIISREDSTQPEQKGLDIVLGEERIAVILDDKASVWVRYLRNLILIKKYLFFGSRHHGLSFDLAGTELTELMEDESESDGALANVLRILKQVHQMFFDLPPSTGLSDNDIRQMSQRIDKERLQVCRMDLGGAFEMC